MRLAVSDDSRVGLLRDGVVVDVGDPVGAGGGQWPSVFLLGALARDGCAVRSAMRNGRQEGGER